jgi:predicted TIM-barrel enzyme
VTTKGNIGAETALTLDKAAQRVQAMHDAAKAVNPDVVVLFHGGPIAEPPDAQYIYDHTEGVIGFFGASSIERPPTEVTIRRHTATFKAGTLQVGETCGAACWQAAPLEALVAVC